ncbi:hypothetical protein QBC45DRAFT_396394 [Copromyces sp. CBS 386.78]|nr:hypothetical protein QBC45DRAFT_396394 [Copromyces sp. CBS 386.78]
MAELSLRNRDEPRSFCCCQSQDHLPQSPQGSHPRRLAGALHTPQTLQRGGVGPAALLQKANIFVLVDLPGVKSAPTCKTTPKSP